MGPRAGLAATLLIAGATLLIAIAVGNEMGNRVLGQATERGPAIGATPVATPDTDETNAPGEANWKRQQIVSVATDPAFPDPRVTPEPPPPPQPRTPVPLPRASATPSPSPTPTPSTPYTSPPLPIPLVTHGTEQGTPGGGQSPEPSASGATPSQ
jgi:hypothetical protein